MKLSKDANARARLRMVRVWVTAEQYRDICSGLNEVEAGPRGELRRRLAAGVSATSKVVVAYMRSMMGMVGGSDAYRGAQRAQRKS